MLHLLTALILLLPRQAVQVPPGIGVDPALQAVVDRFFETQHAEDAAGYLALWSAKATRPSPEQLAFIFESGDDTFTDARVTRALVNGDTARLRCCSVLASTCPARASIVTASDNGTMRASSSRRSRLSASCAWGFSGPSGIIIVTRDIARSELTE